MGLVGLALAVGAATGLTALIKAVYTYRDIMADADHELALRTGGTVVAAPAPPVNPQYGDIWIDLSQPAPNEVQESHGSRQVETWLVGLRSTELQIETDQLFSEVCLHLEKDWVELSDTTKVAFICRSCTATVDVPEWRHEFY